jgi:hypothetical protein
MFPLFFVLTSTIHAQHVSVSEIITAEKNVRFAFYNAQRDSMVTQMNTNLKFYRYLHEFNLPNSVPLPNWFDPVLPTMTFNTKQQPIKWNIPADVAMPADTNQLAFYSIVVFSTKAS